MKGTLKMNSGNKAALLIKQINEALERNANREMKENGLTVSQMNVLMLLNDHENNAMPLKEIEKALHSAQPTVHGLVTRLEEKGLIRSLDQSYDRRIRVITITEKGEQYCREAESKLGDIEEKLLTLFNEEERKRFISDLKKVHQVLI